MKITSIALGAAVGTVLCTTTPVFAQTAEPPADDSPQGTLNDIIVTAQRREQSLQDVPVAVSAFTAADLTAKQIDTTLDLARLVPNMVGTSNVGIGSANTYFIRGLGNTESIATFDPPVGTYVDDIYISRQNANNFSFFDVERIEVLRGPQGTLFGRNTTGGAINVILKKPSSELGGYAEASYGRFDSWRGRASVDLPLSDKVLTKFSGFALRSDGYVKNLTTGERNNGEKSYGARAALRLLPSETITWDVAADYIRGNQVNLPSVLVGDDLVSRTGLNRNTAALAGLVIGRKAGFKLQNITKNASVTSNLQIDTGGPTINIITGYRNLKQDYLSDLFDGPLTTGGFAIVNAGRFEQFTQEVKLTGKAGTIDYVAGAFYIHEKNRTDFADVFTINLGGGVGIPLVLSDRVLGNTTSAPAVYAQIDWHATDELTLTAGGRYTHEDKHVRVIPNPNPLLFGVPYGTADIRAAGIPLKQSISLFTPRVAVEYRTSSEFMMFASATRGFRSGGWNARALSAENFLVFGPEKVWSYETGLRSELLDRTLRFNLTGFYTDVNGFQVPLGFVDSTGAINFVTQNGSDFRDYGVEAEAQFVPTAGLSLFANVGLQRAKYRNPDSTIVAQQASCRAGNAASCGQGIVAPDGSLAIPERTPKFTTSFGGSYDIRLGGVRLTPAANASYTSRQTVGTAGVPGDFVGGEWLVGASLTLRPDEGPWRIGVDCSNCFDNHFVGSNFPPGFKFYNEPMMWRITAGLEF
ncbi:TonB-dependent receptor [Novosphingobium sp. Gsoil 351]|uniref:TonB-dependent receptor n=1 Tax=Novosphingobium sp. Gsoil 351 TaxID=2675225 RepID=UPI0018A7EA85|nr:TonB-dependent receptor [Novosphingobium sp. Gsoil 351]